MRSSAEISILISLAWLRLRRYVLDCGPPMHVHMHTCINRSETSCVASAASSRGSRYSGCVWLLQPGLPRRSSRVIRVPVTPSRCHSSSPPPPPQLIVSPSFAPHPPHCASFYARCRTRSSLSLCLPSHFHRFTLIAPPATTTYQPLPSPPPPLPSEASARTCGHLLPPAFSFSTGEALREARLLIQGDRRRTTPSHKSTCCYCCCCCCGTKTLTPARASDILYVPASDRALPAT